MVYYSMFVVKEQKCYFICTNIPELSKPEMYHAEKCRGSKIKLSQVYICFNNFCINFRLEIISLTNKYQLCFRSKMSRSNNLGPAVSIKVSGEW